MDEYVIDMPAVVKKIKGCPDLFQRYKAEWQQMGEMGDAQLVDELLRDVILYDHYERNWYLWDGTHWRRDDTKQVVVIISQVILFAYQHWASKYLWSALIKRANKVTSAHTLANIIKLCETMPHLSGYTDNWNIEHDLLPVENGIVDLVVGQLRRSFPSDHVRNWAPVVWRGIDEPCPKWEKALYQIVGEDKSTMQYLQRLLGYAITGKREAREFYILDGLGNNGKSLIMDVITGILGSSFSLIVPAGSIMAAKYANPEGPKPFLYSLRGKRIVWMTESADGDTLDDAMIKTLTGDATLTARTLHQKPLSFTQTQKLFLVTNQLPKLSDPSDAAMWRRIVRLRLTSKFVANPSLEIGGDSRKTYPLDPDLTHQLISEEASGILAWLVKGAMLWHYDGMLKPKRVIDDALAYKISHDPVSTYVDQCLVPSPEKIVSSIDLYDDYRKYCLRNEIAAISQQAFGRDIAKRLGASIVYRMGESTHRGYKGIQLRGVDVTPLQENSEIIQR